MLFIFAFIVSLVVTMLLIPPIMKWADKIGAIDLPGERKVHQMAIPRVGGIAMVMGSLLSILFWADLNHQTVGLLVGYVILLFFGIWDDRTDLDYRFKFLGQILAVGCVVIYGDTVVRVLPFFDDKLPEYIAIPFTIFALVGITNAINLSDGLDGLAGGTTLLSLCVIGLLGYQADGVNVVLITMAVAGSILGFLRHNTYPARLFMGDTGSQFLGFSVGALTIMLTQDPTTAVSPALPLIILGLPILDTIAVMVQRIYEGRSPFSPDKNHVHHKLLAIGFDHYEAVMMIYLVQSILVVAAYLMRYESDMLILASYLVFSVTVLLSFHIAIKYSWKFHKTDIEKESRIRGWVSWLQRSGWLSTGPAQVLKIGVPLIFLISVILPDTIGKDISILSLVLLAVLLINFVLTKSGVSLAEKAVSYVVCVLAVYLMQSSYVHKMEYYDVLNYVFVLLAVAFALKVRFAADRSFQITPLDFLVISLVIVVPNIPNLGFDDAYMGEMAVKLIILFYATEALLNIMSSRRSLVRIGIVSSLLIAVVRGL